MLLVFTKDDKAKQIKNIQELNSTLQSYSFKCLQGISRLNSTAARALNQKVRQELNNQPSGAKRDVFFSLR